MGADVVSYEVFEESYNDGLECCACGWLSDGIGRYPTQNAYAGCGSAAGIHSCINGNVAVDHTLSSWCKANLSEFMCQCTRVRSFLVSYK